MQRAPKANNAANREIRRSALYYRIILSGTIWECELFEYDVERLKQNVFDKTTVVDFHLASIYNRYTELFPGSPPEVVVLPEMTFRGWKMDKSKPPAHALKPRVPLHLAHHIAFPYFWEVKERWLLVVLAGFNCLMKEEDGAATARPPEFCILALDAMQTASKTQYSALAKPLREFTAALLRPKLDVDHDAISAAKVYSPTVRFSTPWNRTGLTAY